MTFGGYLASLADSDLFGTLAIICFLVAVSGLSRRMRENKVHKVMVYLCVLIVPALHAIGTYFLNQTPA
jgi:uncharacterized membrane protein